MILFAFQVFSALNKVARRESSPYCTRFYYLFILLTVIVQVKLPPCLKRILQLNKGKCKSETL